MTGALLAVVEGFLGNLPVGTVSTWAVVPYVTTKSLDLQRTGNVVAIGAPTGAGHVMGIGTGQVNSVYSQQQISDYVFKLTLWTTGEGDLESATDWIAQNCVTYFLNLDYTEGMTVLSKVNGFGQKLNERGVWWRTVDLFVKVVIGY